MKKARIILLISIGLLGVFFFWQNSIQPSNIRDWHEPLAVLASAEFNGDETTIHNMRNFHYRSLTDYDIDYYDKTVNLQDLNKVWFIVEPYSRWQAAAHTFLSFQFGDDDFVAITIEARTEKGEEYSPIKGLLKQLEIMYIVADERDVIRQRTNIQNHDVYLYPVNTTPEKMRALFLDMMQRVDNLNESPAFYNTITDSCTSSIVKHVNTITPDRIPLSYKYFLPGYSDELAAEIGLLKFDEPIEIERQKHWISGAARAYDDGPEFSQVIRQIIYSGGTLCTADTKLCPDGSSVGRSGPNCEFAACP